MLGHTAYRLLSAEPGIEAFATVRSDSVLRYLQPSLHAGLSTGVDVLDIDALPKKLVETARADLIMV